MRQNKRTHTEDHLARRAADTTRALIGVADEILGRDRS